MKRFFYTLCQVRINFQKSYPLIVASYGTLKKLTDMSLPGRNFSSAGYFQTPRAGGLVTNYALRGVLDKKASKSEMVF